MKDIILLSNSTMFTAMESEVIHGGVSCVDLLKEQYNVYGLEVSGLTIFGSRCWLPNIVELGNPDKDWIIICLGVVEAYSHTSREVLVWYTNYMMENQINAEFQGIVGPMIEKASKDTHGFYRIIEPEDYRNLFQDFLSQLDKFPIISLGLSKPTEESFRRKPHWVKQSEEYRDVIETVSKSFNNVTYIDCWNTLDKFVVDSTHMNQEGHRILFEMIQEILQ